jgi:hypothetical protein
VFDELLVLHVVIDELLEMKALVLLLMCSMMLWCCS